METPDTTIKLIDIDEAIYDYIISNIAFEFEDNNQKKVKVGVDFKNRERYLSTFQQETKKGKTEDVYQLPTILLKRNNVRIIKNERPHWASEEVLMEHLITRTKPTINKKGEYEYIYSRMPVKIESSYNVDIISSYKYHADHIIEQYILHENKFWNSSWYAFRVSFEDFSNGSTPPQNGQERIIRHTTSMNVEGYILPERDSLKKISTKVIPSVSDVIIGESQLTLEEFRKKYNM